jgi:hypothetical protein
MKPLLTTLSHLARNKSAKTSASGKRQAASKQLSRKAQVAIEFLIISGAVLFFATIFLLTIQQNQQSKTYTQQNIQLQEIALTVQNEINLALESTNGYTRNFQIPQKSGNLEYEITIDSTVIYIKTTNEKHALTLPIPEVIGNINKTQNTIQKINNQIHLNQ